MDLFTDTERGITGIPLPTPFPVGPVNVFLLERDPLTLVDTGLKSDESYAALEAGLRQRGYAVADLEVVLVTHGHRDHMGALGRIQDASDAITYAHPYVARQGREGDASQERREFFEGILVEFGVPEPIRQEANALYDQFRSFADPFDVHHVLNDGERLFEFTAHFVPGHSPSDTLFVNGDGGYTLAGDHILQTTNPNPLLRRPEAGEERAKSLVEYRASLAKSRGLPLGRCFPGHGPPFDDAVETIDRIVAKQDKRARQVFELVEKGAATPYEVSQALFPQLPVQHLHLGLSVAVGHLEVLEEEGALTAFYEKGVLQFSRAARQASHARPPD